jgi:hypothetical protein
MEGNESEILCRIRDIVVYATTFVARSPDLLKNGSERRIAMYGNKFCSFTVLIRNHE